MKVKVYSSMLLKITSDRYFPRFTGLIKEIIRQGISDDKPLFDDQVSIDYVGSELDGKIFVNSRDRNEKFSFSLGKGEVIPAWDLGVATMKRGEIARFIATPKYAYGLKGEKKFLSATNVIFEIELLDFVGKIDLLVVNHVFSSQ